VRRGTGAQDEAENLPLVEPSENHRGELNGGRSQSSLAPEGLEQAKRCADVLLRDGSLEDARSILELSLRLCPNDEEARDQLVTTVQELAKQNDQIQQNSSLTFSSRREKVRKMREYSDEFECVLCLKIFFEPVTTVCGHTFCRECIVRALDHTDSCPMCRCVLHLDVNKHPVNVTLRNIIERCFPDEAAARQEEIIQEREQNTYHGNQLPLFPMSSVVFPGQLVPMHIFEGRYRLMFRRIVQSSCRFGLVAVHRVSSDCNYRPRDVGCVMKIERVETIADGRFFIEARAIGRFRIKNMWEVDGYMVSRTDPVEDIDLVEDPSDEDLASLKNSLRERVGEVLKSNLKPGFFREALRRSGPMPDTSAPVSTLGFWVASVVVNDVEERQRLLEMLDGKERLLATTGRLERLEMKYNQANKNKSPTCVSM